MENLLVYKGYLECNEKGIAGLCDTLYVLFKDRLGNEEVAFLEDIVKPICDTYFDGKTSIGVYQESISSGETEVFTNTYDLVKKANDLLESCCNNDISSSLILSLESIIFVLETARYGVSSMKLLSDLQKQK